MIVIEETSPQPDAPADLGDDIDFDALKAEDPSLAEPNDASQQTGVTDTTFHHEQSQPVPVEHTSKVYRDFREAFGDDVSAELQRHWSDHALPNVRITQALVEDHPTIKEIYSKHQTENGGLSREGLGHAFKYLLEKSGTKDPRAFFKKHSELETLYYSHVDDEGNISPAGFYRMLHYVGKRSGYKFTYRGKR